MSTWMIFRIRRSSIGRVHEDKADGLNPIGSARTATLAKQTVRSGNHAEKKTPVPIRATKDDIRQLKAHSKTRTPVVEVAKPMRRTEGTVRQKAKTIGIGLLGMEAQLKSPACRVCIRPESSNADADHARPYQHYRRTPSPRVSCRDQKPGGRTKSKNSKTGRGGRKLNEKSFACTIRRRRIGSSGRFTNSFGGLVDEPVSR